MNQTPQALPDAGISRDKMADKMVDVVVDDRVLRVTLSRPSSANALHPDAVEELLAALAGPDDPQLSETRSPEIQEPEPLLVILRGNGRHFCAGFDLSDLEDISDGDLLWRFVRIELLLQRVQHAPWPVAAFAHGKVMGAGADLFGVSTHRIAAPGTTFRMPGWNFDLALGTRRLTRRIGSDAARDVLMNSRTIEADEALHLGLVTDIVEQDQWDAHEADLLAQASALSPTATRHLLELTQVDTRAEDLAALVRSASRPGLRARILDYRQKTMG